MRTLSLSAEFKGFARRLDNCAQCLCHLPCDWHMATHVTQPAWWWDQSNQAIKGHSFQTSSCNFIFRYTTLQVKQLDKMTKFDLIKCTSNDSERFMHIIENETVWRHCSSLRNVLFWHLVDSIGSQCPLCTGKYDESGQWRRVVSTRSFWKKTF